MTDSERRDAIIDLIKSYTAANTVSKSAARDALIREGLYTKKGELRVEFGGVRSPKKSKAA